jgi:twitching motility protein PilU
VLKEVVLSKRGLVIMVGGTGSGKSTSLAAMVGYRNEKTRGHIVTIEDPVEYVHQHKGCVITHREVGVDTDNWHSGAQEHAAPGARRHPHRRNPRSRDDGIRHPVRRDRPPRARDPARQQLQPGAGPHHQLLPDERREQLLMDLSLNIRALVSQRLIPREPARAASRRWRSC